MGDDEFIPWDKQHPELLEGDIMLPGSKNAILNQNALWPNKVIPYVISANYSKHTNQWNFSYLIRSMIVIFFFITKSGSTTTNHCVWYEYLSQ